MSTEIMCIYPKENALSKEEIKKLLKKHLLQRWINKQDIEWAPRQ